MEKEYTTVRGFKFSTDRLDVPTVAFYYLVFKALDGEETAKILVDATMKKQGLKIIVDAENKRVYPPITFE